MSQHDENCTCGPDPAGEISTLFELNTFPTTTGRLVVDAELVAVLLEQSTQDPNPIPDVVQAVATTLRRLLNQHTSGQQP